MSQFNQSSLSPGDAFIDKEKSPVLVILCALTHNLVLYCDTKIEDSIGNLWPWDYSNPKISTFDDLNRLLDKKDISVSKKLFEEEVLFHYDFISDYVLMEKYLHNNQSHPSFEYYTEVVNLDITPGKHDFSYRITPEINTSMLHKHRWMLNPFIPTDSENGFYYYRAIKKK